LYGEGEQDPRADSQRGTWRAFIGKGSSKTPYKYFYKKVHVENFPQKNRKFFDVSFSSVFVLSRFRMFLSDGSSKTLQKRFTKKIVSKSFYKKFDQDPKPIFFLDCVYNVFGRFSMRGVQKHDKKISKNKSFWPLTQPPTTEVTSCPLVYAAVVQDGDPGAKGNGLQSCGASVS
jgi:hypothetical protein